jgi:60 kDa SS-A/Ro ribonucleoprotein
MATINKRARTTARTHEGAPSITVGAKEQLARTVMSCMLWEDTFYEDGVSIADRIVDLIPKVKSDDAYQIALDARNKSKLRHVPLLVARTMANIKGHKAFVGKLLPEIIQRPDELTEFLSIYWKEKRQPLSSQVKKGLAEAFKKFSEYHLAKYNRNETVKLKDVLFLTHPKPKDQEQQDLWDRLVKGTIATPDTWEVELSAKGNNSDSWERLLKEKKLGGLALIRNLRNMEEKSVSKQLIKTAIAEMKVDKILPYRFIAAARYAPAFEPELEQAMYRAIAEMQKLKGKTKLLVDISGSMEANLSAKSDMSRIDAACGLAILARELCDDVEIYAFSDHTKLIPSRRGFALRDAINISQPHNGTMLGAAIIHAQRTDANRIIVLTDEQSHDAVSAPKGKGYMINVASNQNGVGYGSWTHINGWSESILDYIRESENMGM